MGHEARNRRHGANRGHRMSAHAATAPLSRRALERTRRALAILVLPASILPLLVLGPAMLRAPEGLVRKAAAPGSAPAAGADERRAPHSGAGVRQPASPLLKHPHIRVRPAAAARARKPQHGVHR